MPDETPLSSFAPDLAPRGGVVVIQEAFGVTGHIEDVGRRLAAIGWYAVIPHLFHRTGDPILPYDDMEAVRPHMAALTPEGLQADVDAAFGALAERGLDGRRAAIVGFCMGGTVACWAAATREIGAAVTFYGGGVTEGRFGLPPLVELAAQLRSPWLGLYGDRDQGIPVAQVERLREAAAQAPVGAGVLRYPDAGHGFHCDARPAHYEPSSAEDAWRRTIAWFEEHVARA